MGDCCDATSSRDLCEECQCTIETIIKNSSQTPRQLNINIVILLLLENCLTLRCHDRDWPLVGNGICNDGNYNCVFKKLLVVSLLMIDLNVMDCYFDGGDCCQTGSEDTCYSGVEFCFESEIGDGKCQDYNKGLSRYKKTGFEIKKQKSILTAGPRCNFDGKDCCQVLDDGITMGKNKNVVINRILLFTICY